MRTEKQIQASRANGAKSQGPVTPEGKVTSSQNALQHGFLAANIVIKGEDLPTFTRLANELYEELQPATLFEQSLVGLMIAARWRQERIWNVERESMDVQMTMDHEMHPSLNLESSILTARAFKTLSAETRTLDLIRRSNPTPRSQISHPELPNPKPSVTQEVNIPNSHPHSSLPSNPPRHNSAFSRPQWYRKAVQRHFRRFAAADTTASGEPKQEETTKAQKPAQNSDTDPVTFARERLGLHPDPRQIEVLQSTAKRAILNCSRQWGKSTIAAAKAVHRAYTRDKVDILVASPSDRQSAIFIRKARQMVAQLGIVPRGDGNNRTSVLLPNGSRIIGLPGSEGTIRGFSAVSLILIDEAAQVKEPVYTALQPMLAVSNGDLWLMSTPKGKQGFFYDTWAHAGPNWFRIAVPATECPRISPDFLEDMRNTLGAPSFAQEFMNEFVHNGISLFNDDLLEAAIDDTFEPLNL